jgi:hypothetical protein
MNIDIDKLTAWNRFTELARNTAISARLSYAKGDWTKGRQHLVALEQAAATASVSMEAAGADRPKNLPPPTDVPLALLSTEASRRYARAVRQAYDAALEVDRERGYGNDGPASALAPLVETAELDAFGAVGMLRE